MFTLYQFDTLDSTNDEAKRHYLKYVDEALLVAKHQTKGRGRFDRVWESNDDLTFSFLFKNHFYSSLLFPVMMVHSFKKIGVDASIKWPNDLVVNGKKVCGMLLETIYEGNQKVCSIVGIGINLSQKHGDLEQKAGFVKADPQQLLQIIINCFEELKDVDEHVLLQEYLKYHMLYHHHITLDNTVYQIDEVQLDGTLLVMHEGQKRYLRSEEISLSTLYHNERRSR